MILLNGKIVGDYIKESLKEKNTNKSKLTLAVIQVGDDPASSVYVNNKRKACEYVGIEFKHIKFTEEVDNFTILNTIDELNADNDIIGILVQLPLPKHLDEEYICAQILPSKDVDGFHEINMGKLTLGKSGLVPCTPKGIIDLLKYYNVQIEGKECVVVGRSNIVGKPMALLMLQENATVTICHSKTKNLKEICQRADILICAIGKPKFFTKDYVKEGAIVVDVGIHRQDNGKLCGDVDFEDVKDYVAGITPVPGGVGPMTVAELVKNCVEAANER